MLPLGVEGVDWLSGVSVGAGGVSAPVGVPGVTVEPGVEGVLIGVEGVPDTIEPDGVEPGELSGVTGVVVVEGVYAGIDVALDGVD